MILLVAGSLALLVIYAGVKLHIQVKKEMLGNLYKYFSWFFIIAGFLMLFCTGACCIAMCCKYGGKMMRKEHKMMGEYYHERHHDMGNGEFRKVMKHSGQMPEEECKIYINCCEDGMEKCQNVCRIDSAFKGKRK